MKPKFGDKWPEDRCVHCGIQIDPDPKDLWLLVAHHIPGFDHLDCLVIGHSCEQCRSQKTDRRLIDKEGVKRVMSILGVPEDVQKQALEPLTNR